MTDPALIGVATELTLVAKRACNGDVVEALLALGTAYVALARDNGINDHHYHAGVDGHRHAPKGLLS